MCVIRAVLFDLDGVLIDSYEVWFQLLNGAAHDLGHPEVTRAAFEDTWGQGIAADIETFFPGHSVAELERYYEEHFLDHAEHLRIDPTAAPLLEGLRRRGIGTALVTNTAAPLARATLARAGLVLDEVVGGTDVPAAKPAPDMVHAACRTLGVAVGEAFLVGDTDYDRLAAVSAGMRFVGMRTEGDPRIEALVEVLALLEPR